MKVVPTPLEGVVVVQPDVRADGRGAFFEAWHAARYPDNGLPGSFAQCNVSRSIRATLRGLHLQHPNDQGKLVTVMQGAIYDVAADVRRGSPTFGRWFGVELTAEGGRQLYIPPGFAHGFLALTDDAVLMYLTTAVYVPGSEVVIRWDDPTLGIAWPIPPLHFSPRDQAAPVLSDLADRLPLFKS